MKAEDIKRRVTAVCICKGIRRGRIEDALAKGCTTVEQVNVATGSGRGGCKAVRCRPVIQGMLDEMLPASPVKKPS